MKIHLTLGALIIVLAALRLVWRLTTPLPPWSDRLSERDRWLENKLELLLIGLLLVTPATGIALLLSGDDDLLWLHVTCHVLLYAAVALHVGLAVRRRTVGRMLTVGA